MESAGMPRLILSWLIRVSSSSSNEALETLQAGWAVPDGVIVAVGVLVGVLVGDGVKVMGRVNNHPEIGRAHV